MILLGYALVDTFIQKTESWAGEPPYVIYANGGVLIALAGYYLPDRTAVPRYVPWVALLTGLASGAAPRATPIGLPPDHRFGVW